MDDHPKFAVADQLCLMGVERFERDVHGSRDGIFYGNCSKVSVVGQYALDSAFKRVIGNRNGAIGPLLLNCQLTERAECALECHTGPRCGSVHDAVVGNGRGKT